MLLPHIFLTIHRDLSCRKCKKKSCHYKILQFFKLSHPIVMGEGAKTMYNQIIFIFSKEKHGNILSMHLTKFRKSEKWKNKKLKFVSENYIYCSQAIIFQNNWFVYYIPILWIYMQARYHKLRIRNGMFNIW